MLITSFFLISVQFSLHTRSSNAVITTNINSCHYKSVKHKSKFVGTAYTFMSLAVRLLFKNSSIVCILSLHLVVIQFMDSAKNQSSFLAVTPF